MMRLKARGFLGIALIILGLVLILESSGITGYVIMDNVENGVGSILGIFLVIGGILLLLGGDAFSDENKRSENLESKVNFYIEERKGRPKTVIAKGIDYLTGLANEEVDNPREQKFFVQVDNSKPLSSHHLNLGDINKLIKAGAISDEDLELIRNEYGSAIKGAIKKGYVDYFEFKDHNRAPTDKRKLSSWKKSHKDERDRLAKELRISRAAERLYDELDPEFKTRSQELNSLKHSSTGAIKSVYNPIKNGTAVYVHFTSNDGADGIVRDGLKGTGQQTLFFPNIDSAEKYLSNMNQSKAMKETGCSSAETAVVFQTYEVPEKMNALSGAKTRSRPKAFFDELDRETMYDVEKKNIPK